MYSGRFAHINNHPSDTGRAQDSAMQPTGHALHLHQRPDICESDFLIFPPKSILFHFESLHRYGALKTLDFMVHPV